ncbi:type II toxin-antitoxin system HicB family antitoxin [Patescibacteria group bacterium]|nr:type II toxin-antitoxin system HicB family antitoxin [Patescibacteria group bacterium]
MTYHFNIIFRPEPEGGFTVIVPSLPGCITYGRDLKEAKEMAKDAIKLYVESADADEDILDDSESFFTSIKFNSDEKLQHA